MSQPQLHFADLPSQQSIGQVPLPLQDLDMAIELLLQGLPGLAVEFLAHPGRQARAGHPDRHLL
jgi:hypothetical protein